MRVEFRKVLLPSELPALMSFDRKIFPAADRFDAAYWQDVESWWMFVDGKKAGCCAFERRGKTLYLSTTGLLPPFQGRGLGALLKSWQIAYARYHGFRRLSAHCRKSNKRMIALNQEFGFRMVRTIRGYYTGPGDAAVLMELRLKHANDISR